jgi:hypothetical protein
MINEGASHEGLAVEGASHEGLLYNIGAVLFETSARKFFAPNELNYRGFLWVMLNFKKK